MYIARFNQKNFKIQTVKEHTIEVANLAKKYGEKLNISSFAYLAGLVHDMGKYSDKFQNYIKMELEKAKNHNEDKFSDVADKEDHGVYGAKYIYEKYNKRNPISTITSELLAIICCYHHGGLPDCINKNTEVTLLKRFEKVEAKQMTEIYDRYISEIGLNIDEIFDYACSEIEILIEKLKIFEKEIFFAIHLFVKASYSILIDADRYNSYLFEAGVKIEDDEKTHEINSKVWEKYLCSLEVKLDEFKQKQTKSENENRINKIRQNISDECLSFAVNKEGIYILTVPTGGGKTLSSLRFALKHAELQDKDRIVYIVPYTTIIEQNSDVVRETLNCKNDLLEYHSNVLEDDKGENYKLLTHRWNNKIIYTTMVQFLNTFYNKGTQDMRRIHNLLNSIIIFDEIQTIPIKCIELFNGCINFLNKMGNSTIVLCSATQPELNKSNVEIMYDKHREMIKDLNNKFKILERVEVVDSTRKEGYTYEEASSFVYDVKQNSNSVLMVCNTVNSAIAIYDFLSNAVDKGVDLYYLSSNLCPAHRKEIIEELKRGLKNNKQLICVSTQLIEAGVDISFNTTVRALAGLDSVAQTSGRGNRNGESRKGFCYIINLRDDEEINKLTEIKLGKTHCYELLNEYRENSSLFDNSLLSPKAIEGYFEYFYSEESIKNNMRYLVKKTSIYDMLDFNETNLDGFEEDYPLQFRYKFKTAGEEFKVIDNDTISILVPYKEGNRLIYELLSNDSIEKKKMILDELGQYSVNIYKNKKQALDRESGLIYHEEYGLYMLKDAFYDNIKGITIEKNLKFLNF